MKANQESNFQGCVNAARMVAQSDYPELVRAYKNVKKHSRSEGVLR